MATINVLYNAATDCGLFRAAANLMELLTRMGHEVIRYPVDGMERHTYQGLEQGDMGIIAMPPILLDQAHDYAGIEFNRDIPHVGYWAWETDRTPSAWVDAYFHFDIDELWVESTFVRNAAIMGSLPSSRIHVVQPCVPDPSALACDPNLSWRLERDKFTFLYAFDMSSVYERKNPAALLRAYREAFSTGTPVHLVLKCNRSFIRPDALDELYHLAGECDCDVDIIDRPLAMSEFYGLMDLADCYVSPHRSEGFGLTIAEAAWLGKPVIATRYGGCCDWLPGYYPLWVERRIVEVPADVTVYGRCGCWADPDHGDLVDKLRWVYENQADAERIGHWMRNCAAETFASMKGMMRLTDRISNVLGVNHVPTEITSQ